MIQCQYFGGHSCVEAALSELMMVCNGVFQVQELEMETANLKNELASLQKTIADGAVQFDVKGIKTKIAARQLIGMCFC